MLIYEKVRSGEFVERNNRFVARVLLDGREQTVHVKNTGRCRELLVPGAEVFLSEADAPGRKTKYDLIAVRREDGELFNIDSQAPNRVTGDWLQKQGFDRILPEYAFGNSRIDFYMERGEGKHLLEVKGCTLDREGIGYFPDAPTLRGTKHLRELTEAAKTGYHAAVAFVMQAACMKTVLPNRETDPAFAEALEQAREAGVQILCLPCQVEPDRIEIISDRKI